ncbi:MAG TPA: glycosyltransferase family 1 protein [Candidatus Acidoferrales bacterium]|nr:glycosyltransferase family 1 protein [Candidatus Acidoferrales bacterium]
MHLAVDAANLLHDRRGIGRYARALLQRYIGDAQDDLRVTLLVPRAWPRLVRGRFREALGGAAVDVRRRKDVVALQPDLVWYPWNGMTWISPIPSVATVHDVWPFAHPAEDLRKRRNEQIPFRTTASRAARIITDSAFSRNEIVKHLDVRPEQVRVVHLGTDAPRADTASAPGQPMLLDGASRYVLFVGESEPRKDLATLQSAMRQLPDALRMTTGLVIAGKPGSGLAPRGHLDGARHKGRAARVLRFERVDGVPTLVTGEVSDALLGELYAGATALAFPSRYEGFGLPVLEAMAHGVPVVAADAASVPEVAADAALYFAPGDAGGLAGALARVLTDVGLAAQLRAAGLTRAATMTWDRCAEATLEIFREVAEQPR